MGIFEIVVGIIAFFVGCIITWLVILKAMKSRSQKIIKEAEAESEVIKKDKILQAKEKFLQLKSEHEKEINNRNAKMLSAENRIKQKEVEISRKMEEVQRKKKEVDTLQESLDTQIELIAKKEDELGKMHKQQVDKLESISGMSAEEAKESLIESLKAEARSEAMSFINDIVDEAKINANKEAKKIVLNAVQRVATETAIENSVTIFHIDSDEVKGQIGRASCRERV